MVVDSNISIYSCYTWWTILASYYLFSWIWLIMNKAKIVFEKIAANAKTKYLLYLEKKLPQISRALINKDTESYYLFAKNLTGNIAAKSLAKYKSLLPNLDESEKVLYLSIANQAKNTGKILKTKLTALKSRN